ncbi:hypothetical protein ACRRTK_017472 [Alexandromys fortis]
MLSVPEFYSRRKQFDGQSSTRLDVSAARSHFLVAGDRKAVLTGTRYTVCRCSRHRIVGAQRDSMGRPGRRLSWSCAPRSARPQADRRLPLAPTVLKSSGAYLPPDRETEGFTPAVELKERGKKGKAVHFAEMDGPASERLTDKRFASRDEKSAKALEKRYQLGNITLDDVKFVALLSLQDTEMQRVCSFTTFMRGLVEKKEIELVMSKLEDAQKYLAQKYCILVLGVGMADKHHMNCGKDKVSDTQKDWKFFESFYTFCTCIAWIVFRRQYLTEIEEEVGRLFRTNMFNIPRRKREDEESGGEKKRMTLVQFRKMMANRPAIKKAVDMRSPVLSTLLPSLREKAQHIVEKKYVAGIKLPPRMQKDTTSLESVVMPV